MLGSTKVKALIKLIIIILMIFLSNVLNDFLLEKALANQLDTLTGFRLVVIFSILFGAALGWSPYQKFFIKKHLVVKVILICLIILLIQYNWIHNIMLSANLDINFDFLLIACGFGLMRSNYN